MMFQTQILNHSKKLSLLLTAFSSLNLACQSSTPPAAPPFSSSNSLRQARPPINATPHITPSSSPDTTPSTSRRSSTSDASSVTSDASSVDLNLPAPPSPSQQLLVEIGTNLGNLLTETRLGVVGDRLENLLNLMDANRDDLAWAAEAQLRTLRDALALDSFRDLIDATEGSDRYFNAFLQGGATLDRATQSLETMILESQRNRRSAALRPFREQVITLITPSIRELFIRIYEQLARENVSHITPLVDVEITTIENVTLDSIHTALGLSPDACQEALRIADESPIPFLDEAPESPHSLQNRWQNRATASLIHWLSYLQEGTILQENLQNILLQLYNSGLIQDDYWQQSLGTALQALAEQEQANGFTYPSIENRLLTRELLASPQLSFQAIEEAFRTEFAATPDLIARIITLSRENNPDSQITEEALANIPLFGLRIQLQHQEQQRAEQQRIQEERQRAEEEERQRAARELLVSIAQALGEPLTEEYIHQLTQRDEAGLMDLLTQRYTTLVTTHRMRTRISQFTTPAQLVTEIQRIVSLQSRASLADTPEAQARAQAERVAREQALSDLRAQVAQALGVEANTLNDLTTSDQLRERLETAYAEHRNLVLVPRDDVPRALRSRARVENQRAQLSQMLYNMNLDELVRQVRVDDTR